jgi:hypothetical protein
LSATSRFVCIWIMALILSFVSDRFPEEKHNCLPGLRLMGI